MPRVALATAILKHRKQAGIEAPPPDELETSAPDRGDDYVLMRIGAPKRLVTLADYRLEMKRIYELACEGKIPITIATRALWLVDRGRIAKLDEEKLEVIRRGGDGESAPFTGLQIVAPEAG